MPCNSCIVCSVICENCHNCTYIVVSLNVKISERVFTGSIVSYHRHRMHKTKNVSWLISIIILFEQQEQFFELARFNGMRSEDFEKSDKAVCKSKRSVKKQIVQLRRDTGREHTASRHG